MRFDPQVSKPVPSHTFCGTQISIVRRHQVDPDMDLPMKRPKAGSRAACVSGAVLLSGTASLGSPGTDLSVAHHTAAAALLWLWKAKTPSSHFRDGRELVTLC